MIFEWLVMYRFFNASAVLKTVESLGVSAVKLSEQYRTKLQHELKNLNFPYRPDAVSMLFLHTSEQ